MAMLGKFAGSLFCLSLLGFIFVIIGVGVIADDMKCDTELLADVDSATFSSSNEQWAQTGKRGSCTADLSFWFEGQLYNDTFTSGCDSCEELEGAPEAMPVCFKGSPETSPIRLTKGDTHVGMYSKHYQWQLNVALIVLGVLIGVSLVLMGLDACNCIQMMPKPHKVTPTSWEKFHDCPEAGTAGTITFDPATSAAKQQQGTGTYPLAASDDLAATSKHFRDLELTGGVIGSTCSTVDLSQVKTNDLEPCNAV